MVANHPGAGTVLVGHFQHPTDAQSAVNHLSCLFEKVLMKPRPSTAGAATGWCVEVLVPSQGPYLHGPEAVEDVEEAVARWHGTMESG